MVLHFALFFIGSDQNSCKNNFLDQIFFFCVFSLLLIISNNILYSNFESLSSQDIRGNCKLAFETGEKLGIPRVIEPADMVC
jgi:hypothetical protein